MHFASYYRWLTYSFLFAPFGFGRPCWRLLDIGSKEGAFASRLAASTDQVVCIDLMVPRSRSSDVKFAVADGQHLPFADSTFDCILMNDVLEHILDDKTALREAYRVLQPGGRLWLSTPALRYSVGPKWVTRQFERAWGHVRRGYSPENLLALLAFPIEVHLFIWQEPCIRALQLPLWVLSRCWMRLARIIAHACFKLDRHFYQLYQYSASQASLEGHLYLFARKPLASTLVEHT